MAIDKGVQSPERVGLLEAAIRPDGRAEILVAEEQPRRLILTRKFSEKLHRREMPVCMNVEVDPDFLGDHALDLFSEMLRRLRSPLACRKQESIRICRQHRTAVNQVGVQMLAQPLRNLEGKVHTEPDSVAATNRKNVALRRRVTFMTSSH